MRAFLLLVLFSASSGALDIREIEPDLEVPGLTDGEPAAGSRVKQAHPQYADTEVRHVLYLPENWKPGGSYPVIVELAGNGPYRNALGDVSSGFVEGSVMGYGLSAGRDYIWLCLPYLNAAGTGNVRSWWGDKPQHDPAPSIAYAKKVVPWICERYGGDPGRIVLCGFSRGAIACNFIGLHDDAIAKLWCGFLPFSHYDGVRPWPYPGSEPEAALRRLHRLGKRPQLVMNEGPPANLANTRSYLESTGVDLSNITFLSTGFVNHNDAWTLRPSPARAAARKWLADLTAPVSE